MGKLYVGNSGSTPAIIKVEEVPKTKFGASVDTWLGNVDENGVLQGTTWTGVLNFAGVKEISTNGLYYAFSGCAGIIGVDLGLLQTVDDYGLYYAFANCSNLISIDLSSLQSVGKYGLGYAFLYCSKLTKISFPSLTSIQSDTFNSATFRNCTALTEIHFRADMQTTIEAMTGYVDKWGATNATIYFDL